MLFWFLIKFHFAAGTAEVIQAAVKFAFVSGCAHVYGHAADWIRGLLFRHQRQLYVSWLLRVLFLGATNLNNLCQDAHGDFFRSARTDVQPGRSAHLLQALILNALPAKTLEYLLRLGLAGYECDIGSVCLQGLLERFFIALALSLDDDAGLRH